MDKVKAILAQTELGQSDIDFLVANLDSVPESDKVRLGLAPAKVEEPVVVSAPVQTEPAPVVETPKKRGRKAVIK